MGHLKIFDWVNWYGLELEGVGSWQRIQAFLLQLLRECQHMVLYGKFGLEEVDQVGPLRFW